jgi:aminopeptidase N
MKATMNVCFSPTIVYERGARTLHALRLRGGDEAFFAILREWTARFDNGNVATADFVALAEEVSGEEFDAFFTAWLSAPAPPPLSTVAANAEATPAGSE